MSAPRLRWSNGPNWGLFYRKINIKGPFKYDFLFFNTNIFFGAFIGLIGGSFSQLKKFIGVFCPESLNAAEYF